VYYTLALKFNTVPSTIMGSRHNRLKALVGQPLARPLTETRPCPGALPACMKLPRSSVCLDLKALQCKVGERASNHLFVLIEHPRLRRISTLQHTGLLLHFSCVVGCCFTVKSATKWQMLIYLVSET